jgi:hypothetical protein
MIARLEGFEPTTPGSEDRCSCPLSYRRTLYRILVSESPRVNLSHGREGNMPEPPWLKVARPVCYKVDRQQARLPQKTKTIPGCPPAIKSQ